MINILNTKQIADKIKDGSLSQKEEKTLYTIGLLAIFIILYAITSVDTELFTANRTMIRIILVVLIGIIGFSILFNPKASACNPKVVRLLSVPLGLNFVLLTALISAVLVAFMMYIDLSEVFMSYFVIATDILFGGLFIYKLKYYMDYIES